MDRSRRHLSTSPAEPIVGQRGAETQPFGTLTRYPLGLSDQARATSVEHLNQLLADTISLRDMYKKHHWQVSGPTFYSLHLLFDKHAAEQTELVDKLAERIQTLGGIALAMAGDVAEMTRIEKPPRGRRGGAGSGVAAARGSRARADRSARSGHAAPPSSVTTGPTTWSSARW